MINIPQIIAGIVAKLLDGLKFDSPRIFAIVGAFIIAIENVLLSGILPFAAQIPAIVVETVVVIAAYFLNSSSFNLAAATPVPGQTVGSWLDQQAAILVEKFKQNSLTSFTAIQALFAGFKFYILTDTSLTWDMVLINGVLSFIMLFTAPRTKPILAKQ